MRDIIAAGLADLGLLDRVPGQAPSQLAEYGHLLLEKNQVMNLTAITDPVKVAQLHMLDCAALLTCADFENRALLDVGTGAGFPGLPLKILVPSLQVTLLDSLNKRVDWLAQVSAQLSLTGIRVIHARAEEQALEKGFRDSFELVTARAVAELRLLCELCLPYVKVGGAFLAMKSVDCGRELEEAAHCIKLLGARLEECRDYTIPGSGSPAEGGPNPEGLSPAVGQDPESPAVRPERCLRQPPRIDTLSVQRVGLYLDFRLHFSKFLINPLTWVGFVIHLKWCDGRSAHTWEPQSSSPPGRAAPEKPPLPGVWPAVWPAWGTACCASTWTSACATWTSPWASATGP